MDSLERKRQDEIADGERWLASFPAPSASPELMSRVKQAAHGELGRLQARIECRRWAPWHGVVAAAAALVLSTTIGWYSMTIDRGLARGDFGVTEILDEFAFDPVDESLVDLETLSAEDAWALSGSSLYEAMEDVLTDDPADESYDRGVLLPPQFGAGEDV
ncbi:MAG: hypothetical protein MI923_18420 [Phycisphaerales bacterium]|nr:hypothetical protein [Phycisphaerales bacterium]